MCCFWCLCGISFTVMLKSTNCIERGRSGGEVKSEKWFVCFVCFVS